MRLGPHETADGVEVNTPPRDSQPPQREPSHQRCQSARSVPTTKMSRRLAPHETTVGAALLGSTPPSDSQPPHVALVISGWGIACTRVAAELAVGKARNPAVTRSSARTRHILLIIEISFLCDGGSEHLPRCSLEKPSPL